MKKMVAVCVLLFILGLILGIFVQKNLVSKKKCVDCCEDKCGKTNCIGNVMHYNIFDGSIPGVTYDVTLDLNTKNVKVEVDYSCSYEDCNNTHSRNSIVLTDEEFDKAKKVIDKLDLKDEDNQRKLKTSFAQALRNIAANDGVFATNKEESFEKMYKQYDDNNDGTVTDREYGNHTLDKIIKDIYSGDSEYLK